MPLQQSCQKSGKSNHWVTCETSQVLLADGQVVFLGDLPFSPRLTMTWLKVSHIILVGCKTQIKKKKKSSLVKVTHVKVQS